MEPPKNIPDISPELERFMQLHGFTRIEDVLKIPAEDLLKMDGFGMRLMIEVYRLSKTED